MGNAAPKENFQEKLVFEENPAQEEHCCNQDENDKDIHSF